MSGNTCYITICSYFDELPHLLSSNDYLVVLNKENVYSHELSSILHDACMKVPGAIVEEKKIKINNANADNVCICIRTIIKNYLRSRCKDNDVISYAIMNRGDEYIRDALWMSADWNIAYVIYRNMHRDNEQVKCCNII